MDGGPSELDSQSGVRKHLERHFGGSKNSLRFVTETGGWAGAKEFAKCGLGVAIIPLAFVANEDLEQLVVRRLDSSVSVRHSLLHRCDDDREVIENLKRTIKDVAGAHSEIAWRRWEG